MNLSYIRVRLIAFVLLICNSIIAVVIPYSRLLYPSGTGVIISRMMAAQNTIMGGMLLCLT